MSVATRAMGETETAADRRVWTVHGQDTLPKLFRRVVAERGDKVAMREKDLGIWRAISWREYGERARHVGLGLVALGLLVWLGGKTNLPLGRLPGDIRVDRPNFKFYFPLTTCVLISVVLTLILWLLRKR